MLPFLKSSRNDRSSSSRRGKTSFGRREKRELSSLANDNWSFSDSEPSEMRPKVARPSTASYKERTQKLPDPGGERILQTESSGGNTGNLAGGSRGPNSRSRHIRPPFALGFSTPGWGMEEESQSDKIPGLLSDSESYSGRHKPEPIGRQNRKLSDDEYLVKAAAQAQKGSVSSSTEIPETEAEAQVHIEAIRSSKRENGGGRNAKDLEAALEL